jgi:uncharacterized protein YbjT (DUF2867 family)
MCVFVTGGTGHTGSYIIPELIAAGHEVTGLARSDTAAAAVSALGAKVRRGDLEDLEGLFVALACGMILADRSTVVAMAAAWRQGTRQARR